MRLGIRISIGFILFQFLAPFGANGQNWVPLDHNPNQCRRCWENFSTIGVKQQEADGFTISDYWVKPTEILSDLIEYLDDKGKPRRIEVNELTIYKLPQYITLKSGHKIDVMNIGIINEGMLLVEEKNKVTSNQAINKKNYLQWDMLADSSRDDLKRTFVTIKGGGGHIINAFLLEIDQGRQNMALKGGDTGKVVQMAVSPRNEGIEKIVELHRKRFEGLRRAGIGILDGKAEAYHELNATNPIDVEEELRRVKESEEEGKRIAVLNMFLEKLHEMNVDNYDRRASLCRRNGWDPYEVLGPRPSFNPIVHVQYKAHPTWEQIAWVYEDASEELNGRLDNWEALVADLPSRPLKVVPTDFNEAKVRAIGTDPIEGLYKFKTKGGEGKIALYPDNSGEATLTTTSFRRLSGVSTPVVNRNWLRYEFSWELEDTDDLAQQNLVFSNVGKDSRSMMKEDIAGAELSDYTFYFRDNELHCKGVELTRIREWTMQLKNLDKR